MGSNLRKESMMAWRSRFIAIGTVAVLIALPLGADFLFNVYFLDLAARVVIIWIALLGYALLAGYTGMVGRSGSC